MNKKFLSAVSVMPLAAAGMLAFAGSAEAAASTGEFQFSGFVANGTINQSGVDFDDAGSDPVLATLGLGTQTDSFTAFSHLFIKDFEFANPADNNPLFDLEAPPIDIAPDAIGDGLDIFDLSHTVAPTFTQNGANVDIGIGIYGEFISATGEVTNGAGNFTFQVNNDTAASVEAQFNNGDDITAAFSGAAFTATSTPEPASLLGLGVVGLAVAGIRRRKSTKS